MTLKKYFLFILAAILLSIYGCASNNINKCSINTSPLINPQKIYVLVKQSVDPIDELIKNLANDIRTRLLKQKINAVIINNEFEIIGNGILVSADILRAYRGGLSKRIEVEYRVEDVATKTEINRGFESIHSKFGYRKITIRLAELISDEVIESTLRNNSTQECI